MEKVPNYVNHKKNSFVDNCESVTFKSDEVHAIK